MAHPHELEDTDVWDMLLTMIEFSAFKERMLEEKNRAQVEDIKPHTIASPKHSNKKAADEKQQE